MNKYLDWAKREYSLKRRLIALSFAGVFFLLLFPYLLVTSSTAIDRWLHLPKFVGGAINPIVGLILILKGFLLGFWSNYAQMTIGRGTPLPVMPTVKLVVQGPFVYCRNPMTLGTFIAYSGVGVWLGSISALAIVLILISLLLCYIKLLEEKELEARYGAEYLEYKRKTPFILPNIRAMIDKVAKLE